MPSLRQAQARHACHYAGILKKIDSLYREDGSEDPEAVERFQAEWTQIRQGQSWAAKNMVSDKEAVRLCGMYSDAGLHLLELLVHPHIRIQWHQAALDAAWQLGDQGMAAIRLTNIGATYQAWGELQQAEMHYLQALRIFREREDTYRERKILGNLGSVYTALGRPEEAIDYCLQAVKANLDEEDANGTGTALTNLGTAYRDAGDTLRAFVCYEQALEIAYDIDDGRLKASILGNIATIASTNDLPSEAIALLEQCLSISRNTRDRRSECIALRGLGNAYSGLGKNHSALESYEQGLTIAQEIGDRRTEGQILWDLAILSYDLDDVKQAIAYGESALRMFEQTAQPDLEQFREQLSNWQTQQVSTEFLLNVWDELGLLGRNRKRDTDDCDQG